jgi:hypothetical protein
MRGEQNATMPEPENDASSITKFLDAQSDATLAIARQATTIAATYARLAPAAKPSYLGMFLVIISIAIEAVHTVFHSILAFSDTMLLIMLVGGLLILTFGSVIEVLMYWLEIKDIRGKERALEERGISVRNRFFGREK